MSIAEPNEAGTACRNCQHFACICRVLASHAAWCRYRTAMTCAVGIECEHGRDVCPACDPCTCLEFSHPEILRLSYRGQHVMTGSRQGWAPKRVFATYAEAFEQCELINRMVRPGHELTSYPCRYAEDRTWGAPVQWHNGRDRARWMPRAPGTEGSP